MESPEQTTARLRAIAEAETAAMVATGEAEAVGLTGSLSTGRLWPSSDLDILIITERPVENPFRWTVRNGVVIHGVLEPWETAEGLRDGYPASVVDQASGKWILDATWALDGLVAMEPLHDPAGRLATLRAFMTPRRFALEVVRPRRPRLLARAKAEHRASLESYPKEPWTGVWLHRCAIDVLAILWLEAGQRIVSHKELDPGLGEIGDRLGAPELRGLFRRAEGVEDVPVRRDAIVRAFGDLLGLYSGSLDDLLTLYPTGDPAVDRTIADCVYARHTIQSVPHALERSCLLHLGSVNETLHEHDLARVPRIAAERRPPGHAPAHPVSGDQLLAARDRACAALSLAPWEAQTAAVDELILFTERAFPEE